MFNILNKNTYYSVPITAKKLQAMLCRLLYVLLPLLKLLCNNMLRFYTLVFPLHWNDLHRKTGQAAFCVIMRLLKGFL